MVSALSFIIAVILTILLALVLYPIAAVFWICGLLGKLSDKIFAITKLAIAYLWKDLKKSTTDEKVETPQDCTWVCKCGQNNNGRFCSECGAPKE